MAIAACLLPSCGYPCGRREVTCACALKVPTCCSKPCPCIPNLPKPLHPLAPGTGEHAGCLPTLRGDRASQASCWKGKGIKPSHFEASRKFRPSSCLRQPQRAFNSVCKKRPGQADIFSLCQNSPVSVTAKQIYVSSETDRTHRALALSEPPS